MLNAVKLIFVLCCAISISGQSNECINCTLYNGECKTEMTGWSAFKMSPRDKTLVVKLPEYTEDFDYETVLDENLLDCVNDGYTITETLETFVCFWSPLLGCQAVAKQEIVNKHHMHSIACKICARYCHCHIASGSGMSKDNPVLKLIMIILPKIYKL